MATSEVNAFSVNETLDCTRTTVIRYSYKWMINFKSVVDNSGKRLTSPTFSAKADDGLKWCIVAYPKGYCATTNHFTICYVRLEACRSSEMIVKYKLYFIDADGEKKYEPSKSTIFVHGKRYPCEGSPLLTARDSLINAGALRDDVLRIVCEITSSTSFDIPDCQLIDDLTRLFEMKQCTDVNIAVGHKEFPAHKAILAARSTVFSAMFEHDMKEQKENRVEITDVDHQVFEELLRFIYTGKVRNIEKIAVDLLAAADKYALDRLKVICQEALHSGLNIDNAVDVLVLADRHNAEQLKVRAIKFINTHMKDILNTERFKAMLISYPHLIIETLGALMNMDKEVE